MQGSFRRGPVTDLRLAGPGSAKPELDWEATSLTLKVTALLEQKGSKTLGLKTAPRLPLKKYNHLPVGRPAMMTWDRSAAFWVSPGGHPGLSRRHQANLGGGGRGRIRAQASCVLPGVWRGAGAGGAGWLTPRKAQVTEVPTLGWWFCAVSRNFFFFDTMGKTVTETLGDGVIQGFVTGR